MARHDVDVVPADLRLVGHQLVPCIAHHAAALLGETARAGGVARIGIVVGRLVGVDVVHADIGGEFQPFPVEAHIGAGADVVGQRIIVVVEERRHRVAVVLGSGRTRRTVVEDLFVILVHGAAVGILLVDRVDRSHQHGRIPDIGVVGRALRAEELAVGVRIVDIGTEIEPFFGREIRTDTHRITFETRGLERTLLVEVTQRSEVTTVFARTVDRDLIFLTNRAFGLGLVEPALVIFLAGILHDLAVRVEKLPDLFVVNIIDIVRAEDLACKPVGGHPRSYGREVALRIDQIVVTGQVHVFHIFAGRHRVVGGNGPRADAHLGAQVYAERFAPSGVLLGRDQDHAVGSAGTVQGSRRSVLEHRHRLDVTAVDRIQVAVERYAVDHQQRGVRSVDRPETADAQFGAAARLSAARGRHDACDLSVEHLGNIGHGTVLELLGRDDLGRASERLLLGRSVSHDDHLVEHLVVGGHLHIDHIGRADLVSLGSHAQERENERLPLRSSDRIVALEPGDRSRGPVLHRDGNAHHRRSVGGIGHGAPHHAGLGLHGADRHTGYDCCQKSLHFMLF